MEGQRSTDQSPQRVVAPMEEEDELNQFCSSHPNGSDHNGKYTTFLIPVRNIFSWTDTDV